MACAIRVNRGHDGKSFKPDHSAMLCVVTDLPGWLCGAEARGKWISGSMSQEGGVTR